MSADRTTEAEAVVERQLYTDATLVAKIHDDYGAEWQLTATEDVDAGRYYTFRAPDGSPLVRLVRWADHMDALTPL